MLRHFSSGQPSESYYFISFWSPICPLAILEKSRWRILSFSKYCRNNARNWLDSMVFYQKSDHCFGYNQIGQPDNPNYFMSFSRPILALVTLNKFRTFSWHRIRAQVNFHEVTDDGEKDQNRSKYVKRAEAKFSIKWYQNASKIVPKCSSRQDLLVYLCFRTGSRKKSQWADSWSYAPPFFDLFNV